MTIRKTISAASLLVLSAALPAAAQVYTLDSCRNMAVGNNKNIRMAEEVVKGAGYDRKAARAAYLPGFDFTGTYMYNQHNINLLSPGDYLQGLDMGSLEGMIGAIGQKYPALGQLIQGAMQDPAVAEAVGKLVGDVNGVVDFANGKLRKATSYDVHNVFAGAIIMTQPVYMGGQIRALNSIADHTELAARAGRNALAQEVVYGVDQAYWMVVSLRHKQKLAESFVELVDTLHYNVKCMLDEGVATKSNLLMVDVKLNEAKIALTKVNNGLTLARMALAQLCGKPVDSDMHLADEETEGYVPQSSDYSYDMEDVYARRQDLEVVRQGISMLKGREKLALGMMLPKVGIIGAYAFSNPNVINGFEKRFGGGFHIGAAVTIPLWHWGGNYNHYKATKAATNSQRLALEDLEDKVQLQVKQAKFSYEEAYKTYDMTLSNLKSAQANLDDATYGFHEGVITIDDVIGAQTAWLKANSEKIDAEIGIRLCEVYLSKVLGNMRY